VTGPDYEHFCKLILTRSGLVLDEAKAYLVKGRLEPIAKSEGMEGVEALLAALRKGVAEPLVQRCVDAMATHESYFFRDATPFTMLAEKILPPLIKAREATKSLRIWCAACSSGQEPYSVAMVLQEMSHKMPNWKLNIVATDMSGPILQKAKAGIYSDFEVKRGLAPERLARWFKPEGNAWQVSPVLQQMVEFKPHNLLQGATGLGVFDIILCRNVLIYFDVEKKKWILEQIARALAPDGALLLGSSETVLGITEAYDNTPGARGLYRKAGFGQTPLAKTG
jgi:chemotaxis protein methyltransferase CheR